MTRIILDQLVCAHKQIMVDGDEFHYLSKVRRSKIGEMFEVLDKEGNRFSAVVLAMSKSGATVEIGAEMPRVADAWPVRLIVAIPKRSLFDDIVRKANEMGVAQITPVIAKRTIMRPNEQRVERWRKIAKESIRQCGRRLPIQVDDVVSLNEAIMSTPKYSITKEETKLLLCPDINNVSIMKILKNTVSKHITIAIGPEGGFADEELEIAKQQGFTPVKMGQSILRVETASLMIAALSIAFVGGLD